MNLPIVTSDLAFARDICGDAALYFEPNQTKSAAQQLSKVVQDEKLRERLTENGKGVLKQLPSPRQQYLRYGELLSKLVAEVGIPREGQPRRKTSRT